MSDPIDCPVAGAAPPDPGRLAGLRPLLEHLRADAPHPERRAFPVGTVQADGRLDLCKQGLGPDGCAAVAAALAGNTATVSLLLGTNAIGDEGAAEVARLIGGNRRLEIVYLGCNAIGPQGAAALAGALAENRSVTGLWLKRNPIGAGGMAALAAMLRRNQTLRTLDLVNVNPAPADLEALIDGLAEENRTIERLYLGGNRLGPEAAGPLARLLRANPALGALFLNVNHLGDRGAAILAAALAENRSLRELGLASNGIGAAGAAALAEALRQPGNALRRLDLGYSQSTRVLAAQANLFGDAGAAAIADWLAADPPLRALDLRNAGIEAAGRARLAAALESNTTLRELIIDGRRDPAIGAILERNRRREAPEPTPRDVALIKSVYRAAPVGAHAAPRGE